MTSQEPTCKHCWHPASEHTILGCLYAPLIENTTDFVDENGEPVTVRLRGTTCECNVGVT